LAKQKSRRAKRKGGLGEGKRFRNSVLAGRQNRKIFVPLIKNNLCAGAIKKCLENFLFCSPKRCGGRRKRWAGLSPAGRQLKVNVRIMFKESSNFAQKTPPTNVIPLVQGYISQSTYGCSPLGIIKYNYIFLFLKYSK